jgi:hypothetical protein
MPSLAKIISQNKKILALVLGVGLFLSLVPMHSAQAIGWGDLFGGITKVGQYILTLPLRIVVFALALGLFLLALVFGFIFFLITSILSWITGAFLQVGITPANPATPEIIDIGWNFSKDFVNMLFILVLVFIGLATILKIRDYEAKKTLPLLIVIALLINFSGVIVGFIVDVGNILTNFFLQNTTISNIGNVWDLAWNYFSGSVKEIFGSFEDIFTELGDMIGIIVYGIILLLFYIFANFVYFIIVFIFFSRILVLWILTILAPFAFAAYILPITRKWWSQWWQQLIQWSIIGIPIGFFLYLSSWMLSNMTTTSLFGEVPTFENTPAAINLTDSLVNLVTSILTPLLALAMLAFGVFLSLQMAPSSAQGVINMGRKAGMATGRFVRTQTLGRALATERGKKWMRGLERAKLGLPETRKEWREAGWGKRLLGAITAPAAYPVRWGLRTGATAALGYGAQQNQMIESEKEKLKKQFGKDYERAAVSYSSMSGLNWQKKIAFGRYLAETKGGKALGKLSAEQRADIVETTARYTPNQLDDLVKYMPNITSDEGAKDEFGNIRGPKVADIVRNTLVSDGLDIDSLSGKYKDDDVQALANEGIPEADLVRKAAFKKTVDAMKNIDIESMSPKLADNPEFQEAVARWKPWSFIRKMMDEWGSDVAEKLQTKAEEIDPSLESIARTNPTFIRAPYTPMGKMYMRPWMAQGREIREGEINSLIGRATKPSAATLPSYLSQEETNLIRSQAQAQFNADPSKPLADYEREIKEEYEKQYRPSIFSELERPGNQAWVKIRAQRDFGGDEGQAWQARYKEVAERIMGEKELPTLRPKPTDEEKEKFSAIAEGAKKIPAKLDKKALRDIQGGIRAIFRKMEQMEKDIEEKALEIERKEPTASPAEIQGLRSELNDMEMGFQDYKSREGSLKRQEGNILSRLAQRVKP